MLVRLHKQYGQAITSGSQIALLGLGVQSGSVKGWALALALMAAVSLFAWMSAYRRHRAVADTPTSKIVSAAQGYAEIVGRCRPLAGMPLLAPLTGLPCLWYRYRIERRHKNGWIHEEGGESDDSFLLDDGSGECLVDPEGAEILPTRKDTWTRDDRRYSLWLLLEHDPIYVLGEFSTRGSVDLELDRNADIKATLTDWKKDMSGLVKRFDRDGDGELSLAEWERARTEAKREVLAAHRDLAAIAELNVLRRPEDGRIYLISALPPDKLDRRYDGWAFFHLSVFFAALAGLGFVLNKLI
jgi:hypothetical protein